MTVWSGIGRKGNVAHHLIGARSNTVPIAAGHRYGRTSTATNALHVNIPAEYLTQDDRTTYDLRHTTHDKESFIVKRSGRESESEAVGGREDAFVSQSSILR
jgi:hypothetical protein